MYKLGLIILVLLGIGGCASSPETTADLSARQLGATYNAQLAIGYLKQGNIARATIKLNKAVTAAPELPLVQYSLGYFLERAGDMVAAEKAFRKAVSLDRDAGETHNNYGTFLCRMQRYDEADKQFLLAVADRFYPGAPKSYENAGLCALDAGHKDQAYHYFSLALRQDPGLANSLLEMADFEYQRGNYDKTLNYLKRYRTKYKLSARGLWLGIQAASKAGDRDTAASFTLVMRHQFASSKEYDLMREYLKE